MLVNPIKVGNLYGLFVIHCISVKYCVHESKLEVLLCYLLSSLVMSCVLVGKVRVSCFELSSANSVFDCQAPLPHLKFKTHAYFVTYILVRFWSKKFESNLQYPHTFFWCLKETCRIV